MRWDALRKRKQRNHIKNGKLTTFRLLLMGFCILAFPGGECHAQQDENPDGSFTLDVGGDVDVQLLFSKALFRNFLVISAPPTVAASCNTGSTTLNQCFLDTGACSACPQRTPGEVTCECILNDTKFLGNFPAGTVFRAQLHVDENRDGTIDHVWSWDPSLNSDNFDHLRTFKLTNGVWILEWEDAVNGGDQDFNDLVAMIRVRPTGVPSAAVSLTALSVGADRTPPPQLKYLTNVVVEDQGVPNRKVRLTVLLLNPTNLPQTVAACTMLNFHTGTDETLQGYHYNPGDGTPDCSGTLPEDPSVRYSREQQLAPACPHAAPLIGDQVPVPAAVGSVPGETAVEYEIGVADIDPFITQAVNKLGVLSATQIRQRINDPMGEGLYTDFLYNLHVPKILCPSGPMTWFDGNPDITVADGTYTWNHPTSVSIASPVTINVPTINAFTMDPTTPPISSILDFLWTDNLANHLKGHIHSSPGPRTPFPAGGSGTRAVPVTLDFPNTLPEGFQGKLEAILRDVATGHVLVTTTEVFAKDSTPPAVSAAHTERTAASLAVTSTVSDPPSGLGQVRLTPTVNGLLRPPQYMRRTSGDFHGPTGMSAAFAGLQPLDTVAVDLVADDGSFNTTLTFRLPVANTGGDRSVECTSPRGAFVTLDGSRSRAPTDVPVTFVWTGPFGAASGISPSVQLPLGPSSINLTLTDGRGFTGSQTSTITVRDTTSPNLSVRLSPNMLWPPNHKLVLVTATVQVSDTCDPNPRVELVSITSNEPQGIVGAGNTRNDIQAVGGGPIPFGTDVRSFLLRAERSGVGTGRVYTVAYKAIDASGNSALAITQVRVPHDQGQP